MWFPEARERELILDRIIILKFNSQKIENPKKLRVQ